MAEPQERSTGTLGKTLVLLDLVAAHPEPMRFSDILRATGQPRGTVHRRLSHLVEEGLLEVDGAGRYCLGLRLLTLAARAWSGNDIRILAEPHLKDLQARTGETVHFAMLRGADVVYLDKVEGHHSLRLHSQIGRASPVYCTGVGKAALAQLSDAEVARRLRSTVFKSFTPATHRSLASLLSDLEAIRQAGYAFDREEHEAGICCVAAPVALPGHEEPGAVSITGPTSRLAERLDELAPLIRETASAIAADLILRLGPRL